MFFHITCRLCDVHVLSHHTFSHVVSLTSRVHTIFHVTSRDVVTLTSRPSHQVFFYITCFSHHASSHVTCFLTSRVFSVTCSLMKRVLSRDVPHLVRGRCALLHDGPVQTRTVRGAGLLLRFLRPASIDGETQGRVERFLVVKQPDVKQATRDVRSTNWLWTEQTHKFR